MDAAPRFGTCAWTSFELPSRRGPAAAAAARALEAVDRVLPSLALPVTPIRFTRSRRFAGGYGYARGLPLWIELSRYAHDLSLSFLHEVGHAVDHQLLRGPTWEWGSEAHPELAAFRAVVAETRSYRELQRLDAAYWLRPRELFARAFAQWVALRARESELHAALATRTPRQWRRRDFAPVAIALDSVLA